MKRKTNSKPRIKDLKPRKNAKGGLFGLYPSRSLKGGEPTSKSPMVAPTKPAEF